PKLYWREVEFPRSEKRIEEASMRQQHNQNQNGNQIDQKKGSADCDVTGSKKGMPGGEIGRNSMASSSGSNAGYGGYQSSHGNNTAASGSSGAGIQANHSQGVSGRSDYGGSEGNSRERKTARNGSDSNES